jgi:hypothetical protein
MNAAAPAFLTSVTTPSLTSPASTNLTLAAGGTNQSVILTPSGTGGVGIGTTTPYSQLDVFKTSTGGKLRLSSNVNSTYGELIFSSNDAGYLTYGSSIEGTGDSNGLNVGDLIFKTGYGEVRTERMKISRTGVVTMANSTAGSSSAGALVVTGGLSAGNNGGASYFGGVITATGDRPFQSVNDGKTWIVGPSTDGNFYITQVGVGSLRVSHTSGNVAILGTISPQQATTASAPAYVKGAIYFDTTLNKLRVGGAAAWETITSV